MNSNWLAFEKFTDPETYTGALIIAMAIFVLACFACAVTTRPFPLRDRYELWLLDRAQQPLCLLHSVVLKEDIMLDISLRWRAGNLCAELFRPPLGEPEHAATILTQHINDLTADPATARALCRRKAPLP